MSKFTKVSTGAVLLACCGSSLFAAEIPAGLDMTVSFNGGSWNMTDNPESFVVEEDQENGMLRIIGDWDTSNWGVEWVMELPMDASGSTTTVGTDFISNAFTLTNNSGVTQPFQVLVTKPSGPFGPFTSMNGSNSGNTGDTNANGSTIATNGPGTAFYTALLDGVNAQQLFGHAFSVSAAVDATNSYGPGVFNGVLGPAVTSTIGILNEFTLTPGDNAGMTSTLRVTKAIPTPGSVALLAIAGVFGTRRRR